MAHAVMSASSPTSMRGSAKSALRDQTSLSVTTSRSKLRAHVWQLLKGRLLPPPQCGARKASHGGLLPLKRGLTGFLGPYSASAVFGDEHLIVPISVRVPRSDHSAQA